MTTLVISYSFTGNNAQLAKHLADSINADFCELKEKNKRTIFTILLDALLNRTPAIHALESKIENYEHVVLAGPVWFGKAASPLRNILKELKGNAVSYSLVSISAGPTSSKETIFKDLSKRSGFNPMTVINPLISELLPNSDKLSHKELGAYRITESDILQLSNQIKAELENCWKN